MKHKFNIGDKVLVLTGFYVGTEGKVIEFHKTQIGKRKGLVYVVKHNSDAVADGLYWATELKLLEVHKTKEAPAEVFYAPYVYEDMLPESERSTPEERLKRNEEYDKFMEDYHNKHAVCPKCGSTHYTHTLAGYIFDKTHPENYKDKNSVTCNECGWHGIIDDLVSKKDINK